MRGADSLMTGILVIVALVSSASRPGRSLVFSPCIFFREVAPFPSVASWTSELALRWAGPLHSCFKAVWEKTSSFQLTVVAAPLLLSLVAGAGVTYEVRSILIGTTLIW